MKNEMATNPAYRQVVAALNDCEERYDGLIKSIEVQAQRLLEKGLAAVGLHKEVLSRLAGSDVRKVALANLLLERTVARQSWIAEHLVMRSAANVSQQVRRYRLSKPQLPPKLKTYLSAVKIC
jgi:hypothetical protein